MNVTDAIEHLRVVRKTLLVQAMIVGEDIEDSPFMADTDAAIAALSALPVAISEVLADARSPADFYAWLLLRADENKSVPADRLAKIARELSALYASPQPPLAGKEVAVKADKRYPSMFFSPDKERRIGVAHYRTGDGFDPTVNVAVLLENKPGGRWFELDLAPDEAEQLALHILQKVASVRSALAEEVKL